jgi:hypothetical protein
VPRAYYMFRAYEGKEERKKNKNKENSIQNKV